MIINLSIKMKAIQILMFIEKNRLIKKIKIRTICLKVKILIKKIQLFQNVMRNRLCAMNFRINKCRWFLTSKKLNKSKN